ncbi:hypothetical protein DL770_009640 [Monosporascus sp. CRB-9-2]|nr:hypothetical protein DL770_009640 [Monosporascus sp. CRB-9-2]
MSIPTTSSVSYNTPKDWVPWKTEFRKRADNLDVWEFIDPESNEAWPVKPKEPRIQDFPKRNLRAVPRQQSSESITVGASQQDEPDESVNLADLTADGQKAYTQAWSEFTYRDKRYYDIRKNLKELSNWVISSVSPTIQETALLEDQNLRDWYATLAVAGKVYENDLASDIQNQYRQHLKLFAKSHKKIEEWIQRWEEIMAKGRKHGVPEITDCRTWVKDLLAAVAPVLGNWASNFRMTRKTDIANGKLSYLEVAADIRDEWTTIHSYKIPGRNMNASFPALHGKEGEPIEVEDDQKTDLTEEATGDSSRQFRRGGRGDSQGNRGRGGRKLRDHFKRKRQEFNSEVESGRRCRACLQIYQLSECLYVFPEKATTGWKPFFPIQELVKYRMASDTALENEIRRLKKEQKQEPDS